MNLRVTPKNPADATTMSWMAQKLWERKVCEMLAWAPDDPRAIIFSNVTDQPELRRTFDPKFFNVTEEP